MSASVGSLNVEVNLQLAKMQAQFDQMAAKVRATNAQITNEFKGMTDSIKGFFGGLVPAVSAAGLIEFSNKILESGLRIQQAADAAQMNAESFQVFGILAKEAGLGVDQLTRGLDLMEKKIADAAEGVKSAQKPFDDLGLNYKDLAKLAPEKQFELIARSVVGAKDQTAAFTDAMDILGTRVGPKLLEVMKRIATEGFDNLKAKMEESGRVLSDSVVAKLAELGIGQEGFWDSLFKRIDRSYAEFAASFGSSTTDIQVKIEEAQRNIAQLEKEPQANTVVERLHIWQAELVKLQAELAKAQAAQAKLTEEATAKATAAIQPTIDAFRAKQEQESRVLALQGAGYDALGSSLTQYRGQIEETTQALLGMAAPNLGGANFGDLSGPGKQATEAAKRLFEETRDPIEKYEASLQEIGHLLEEHAIDADTAGRAEVQAMEKYQEEIAKTNPMLKDQREELREIQRAVDEYGSKISDTLVEAANGSKTAFADLARFVVEQLEKMAAEALVVAPLFHSLGAAMSNMGLGGAFASSLTGYGVPGRASGGPVSMGQPYVVGEQGPELFVPSGSGTIVPGGATGGATFNQSFSFGSGVTHQELAAIIPHLVNQVKAAVAEEYRRGGPYSQVFNGA